MNRTSGPNAGQIIGTMNGQQVIGPDIAKHLFGLETLEQNLQQASMNRWRNPFQ